MNIILIERFQKGALESKLAYDEGPTTGRLQTGGCSGE